MKYIFIGLVYAAVRGLLRLLWNARESNQTEINDETEMEMKTDVDANAE